MSGINKNFVVKNGFEVNQDLLYADADLNKIGIGTANPAYTLDVIGDIGISGGIGIGGTTGLSGQYLISTGAGVTWSSFTSSLRVGFNTIANTGQTSFSTTYSVGLIDVFVNGVRLTDSEYTANDGNTVVLNANCFGGEIVDIIAYSPANSGFATNLGGGGGESYWTQNSTGIHTLSSVGIGTTNATETLTVFGDARVTGILTIGTASITLDGSNNNAYIGSGVSVYGDTGEIYLLGEKLQGIGNSSNINTSGIITASYFYGDGSNLTNLPSGGESYWVQNNTGIHTLSNVGIGTTTATASAITIGSTTGISFNYKNVILGDEFTGSNLISDVGNFFGVYNNFIGHSAGKSTDYGIYNNFIGAFAGFANTTGSSNNFFGAAAGCYNTSGSHNNFIGQFAGGSNNTGSCNNFFGCDTGACNISGSFNNFFGGGAGLFNVSGSFNTFLGEGAGAGNTLGSENVVIGYNRNTSILDGNNQLAIGAGSTDWIVGNSSYNIGLGTTNPTSRLTVQGDVTISGVVTASSFVGNLTGTATTATTSTNVIGGIGSLTSLSVSGISTLGTVQISSGIITASSGIITYYGDGSKLSNISSGGISSISISTNTTNSTQYLTYATGFGNTTGLGATNNLSFNPSTGNLGIGTTNPTSKLSVIGNSRIVGTVTATAFVGDGSGLTGVIGVGTGVSVQSSGTTLGAATTINFGSNLTVSSISSGIVTVSGQNYWVQNSSGIHTLGNVGIGTTNPTARLSIASTSSGNSVLTVNDNLSDGSLLRVNNSSGNVLFDVDADGTILFPTTGNVGIGTTITAPTSKVQVEGNVNIKGQTVITNNNILTINENLGDGSLLRVNNSSGNVLFDVDADGTILFPTTGNVGIGTTITAPTSKVQVEGNIGITGDVNITGTTKVKGFTETQGSSTITSNVLSLNAADGTVFTHTTSSQIGIVSFSNISTSSASVQTFTVLVTQGVTPVNVISATGIGTQLATIVTTSGVGISTNIKVSSGSPLVLTNVAGALDVLTFIVSYNGVGIASTNFTIIGLASTNFR